MKDKNIIELSVLLSNFMRSADQYNERPTDSNWDRCTDMRHNAIDYMKEIPLNDATIGAILAECGGAYWYKDDGEQYEDTDIIDIFTPDKIKERLDDFRKNVAKEAESYDEKIIKADKKMKNMEDIISIIDRIKLNLKDMYNSQNAIDEGRKLYTNMVGGHVFVFEKDDIKELIENYKKKIDSLLDELRDSIEDIVDKGE